MTYHHYNIGDFASTLQQAQSAITGGSAVTCPPSSTYKTMVARGEELERTWNPTGYYDWRGMADVIAATVQLAGQASSAAVAFFSGNSTPSAKDRVRRALDRYNDIAKQSVDYTAAWQAAKSQNLPVAAPGFKKWVIDDLQAAAELFRTVEIEVCNQPWWITAAVSFSSFFVNVVSIAKRVTGVVIKVGEAALKAVERTGGLLAFAIPLLPFAAVGVGAYLLYRHTKKG